MTSATISTKKISIVSPCYNEEDNVELLILKVRNEFEKLLNQYDYEHIFIDNCSTDQTITILEKIAQKDKKIKIILNSRNFGHIRSSYYGILQGSGDATFLIASDLQDPPELIPQFIKKWEEGNEIVIGIKEKSHESKIMFAIRCCYYNFVDKISEIKLVKNYTGFGLYDKKIISLLAQIKDPYPYLRGLIFELGFSATTVPYTQPIRTNGISKYNFMALYDMAMLGIFSHSKIPLRIATITGSITSVIILLTALISFILKIFLWNEFSLGKILIILGIFLFLSLQLFFLGLVGEYLSLLLIKTNDRPLVIEKKRINF